METWFDEDVSSEKVDAMAWLLGFWIGNGYRRGAIFALHNQDHDINEYLRFAAEELDMILTIKETEGVGFRAEVKEYFVAGLIDSDGSTSTTEGTTKVAIKTASEPTKDGILFIVRSLGLNLTVSFEPGQILKADLHQNDTWILHFFEGANKSVFWSILNKCSCKRKRQPRELKECRVPRYPPAELEESGTARLNVIPMTFDTHKKGKGILFAVYLKDPSGSFITEEQLICHSASLDNVRHEVSIIEREESYFDDEKNFCHSCARARDSEFEQIPRDTTLLWCQNCRKRHQETKIICLNDSCREIPSKDQARQMEKAGKLCCFCCGSEVRIDAVQKRSRASGECANCGALESSSWRKLPWNRKAGESLCKKCSYSHTVSGKHCVSCCKVFGASEVKKLVDEYAENNEFEGGYIPCPRCKKPTNIDIAT